MAGKSREKFGAGKVVGGILLFWAEKGEGGRNWRVLILP